MLIFYLNRLFCLEIVYMKKVVRVLSIDGGGVRGLIPALVLEEVEKRTGKRISELFDLIAGTSTGGIISLGLTAPDDNGKPKYTATDLVEFYETRLPTIFNRSTFRKLLFFLDFFSPKYSPSSFEENVESLVGKTKLSESITEVLIPSYEIEKRETIFFKSQKVKADTQDDYYMKDVARATSAAPTFFPAAKIKSTTTEETIFCIDGGTFASDPAMCAYAEAKNMHPEMESIILVSLGTGSYSKPISYSKASKWGALSWTVPLLGVLFDGMPDTVEYQLKKILNIKTEHQQYFIRLQPMLDAANDSLDNASSENLKSIRNLSMKLIEEKSTLIDEMCRLLTDPTLK